MRTHTDLRWGSSRRTDVCRRGWIVLWEPTVAPLVRARSFAITSPRSRHVRVQDEGRRKEDEAQDHTGSVREPSARSPLSTAQYFLPKKDANKLNGYRRISGGERKEGVVKVVELNKLLSVGEIFKKKRKRIEGIKQHFCLENRRSRPGNAPVYISLAIYRKSDSRSSGTKNGKGCGFSNMEEKE